MSCSYSEQQTITFDPEKVSQYHRVMVEIQIIEIG
jgi:hypothetical protein